MLKQRDFFTRVEDLESRVQRLQEENIKRSNDITVLQANLFIHTHPPLFKKGQCVIVIFGDARKKGVIASDEIFSISKGPKWQYRVEVEGCESYVRSDIFDEQRLYPNPDENEPKPSVTLTTSEQ